MYVGIKVDSAVYNLDRPVRTGGNIAVMGDHYQGGVVLTDNLLRVPSPYCWSCCRVSWPSAKIILGLLINDLAIATLCC